MTRGGSDDKVEGKETAKEATESEGANGKAVSSDVEAMLG